MSNATPPATLLNYAIDTVPDPLQASPDTGDPVIGVLTIIVSNGTGKAINLQSLTISLPVGPNAKDLTLDANSIMASADPERLWAISPGNGVPGAYIIQPVSGKPIAITGTGVVFQFFNIPVNTAPGTFTVNIGETASLSGTMPIVPAYATISLTKFPYGFFFSNLVPSAPSVNNSNTVTLTWQGSTQAKYFMLYNDQRVDVSNIRKWESPALIRDTTFLLKAISESNGETVERGLSTTVNVMNPDLVASSLNVSGDATIDKTFLVNGSAKIQHDLQVTGNVNVNETVEVGALNVGGGAAINGMLNVKESAIFGTTVSIGGNTTIGGDTTINGATTISGELTLNNKLIGVNAILQSLSVSQNASAASFSSNSMVVNYASIQHPTLGDTVAQNVRLGLWNFYVGDYGVLLGYYGNNLGMVLRPPLIPLGPPPSADGMPEHQANSPDNDKPLADPQN